VVPEVTKELAQRCKRYFMRCFGLTCSKSSVRSIALYSPWTEGDCTPSWQAFRGTNSNQDLRHDLLFMEFALETSMPRFE